MQIYSSNKTEECVVFEPRTLALKKKKKRKQDFEEKEHGPLSYFFPRQKVKAKTTNYLGK